MPVLFLTYFPNLFTLFGFDFWLIKEKSIEGNVSDMVKPVWVNPLTSPGRNIIDTAVNHYIDEFIKRAATPVLFSSATIKAITQSFFDSFAPLIAKFSESNKNIIIDSLLVVVKGLSEITHLTTDAWNSIRSENNDHNSKVVLKELNRVSVEKGVTTLNRVVDSSGHIINQNLLESVKFGIYTSDYNGCGWIAVYNSLIDLGKRPQMSTIVSEIEKDTLFFGSLGAYYKGIAAFFREEGYYTTVVDLLDKKTIPTADSYIIMYIRPDMSGHYVSFTPTGKNSSGETQYQFYNSGTASGAYVGDVWYIQDPVGDIRTLNEFLASEEIIFKRLIAINKSVPLPRPGPAPLPTPSPKKE